MANYNLNAMYQQYFAQQAANIAHSQQMFRQPAPQQQLPTTPDNKSSMPRAENHPVEIQQQQQPTAVRIPSETPGGKVVQRPRATYNRYQREFLNAVFEHLHYPSRLQREAISRCLGNVVNQNQVKVWFQNARRRSVLRGAKFAPGRSNPLPSNQSDAANAMIDSYHATINHYVNEIVKLGDFGDNTEKETSSKDESSRQSNESAPPAKNLKRSRPQEKDEEPASKRPAVEESQTVSPSVSEDTGIDFSTGDANQSQSTVSPTDPRSYMAGSRASSGFQSSLSNYSSPPVVSSTPNPPACQFSNGYNYQQQHGWLYNTPNQQYSYPPMYNHSQPNTAAYSLLANKFAAQFDYSAWNQRQADVE